MEPQEANLSPLPNIDREDMDDANKCAEYALDIFNYFKSVESSNRVHADYMSHQVCTPSAAGAYVLPACCMYHHVCITCECIDVISRRLQRVYTGTHKDVDNSWKSNMGA